MKIIIAVTGASGSVYARLLIQRLNRLEKVEDIAVIFTVNGKAVMAFEEGTEWLKECEKVRVVDNHDFFSSLASGSGSSHAMVVVPASTGMAARVAGGISNDLVSRACDVMLKERRPLIFVVRETPFSLIHLNNLAALTQAGAVVMPASPSFYSKPETIEDLCKSIVDRILSLLGIEDGQYRWGNP